MTREERMLKELKSSVEEASRLVSKLDLNDPDCIYRLRNSSTMLAQATKECCELQGYLLGKAEATSEN